MNGDRELLQRIKSSSDKDAYRILYLRYCSPLIAYCSMFVRRDEAEDIVQNLLLKVWESRQFLKVFDSFSNFLFLSARNACLDNIKHKKVKNKAFSDMKLAIIDEAADCSAHSLSDLKELIIKALGELPEEQRRAFEMNRFEGKTYREIAAETGVSEKTVEYRISRALAKLEESLKDYLPSIVCLGMLLNSNFSQLL